MASSACTVHTGHPPSVSLWIQEPQTAAGHSLGRPERQVEVVAPVPWVELVEVEGVREEVVDERAEGHAVSPAGGEVLHLDRLQGWYTGQADAL